MAIVHARVDERLIHGQVAMVWTNTVGASRIIVVNDEAVKDELIIAGLKMAKPAGVKLSILSLKRAAEKFGEKAYEEDKVFLITKNVTDMAALIRSEVPIKAFNVGNVAKREGSRPIKKSVNLTEDDEKDIREMVQLGVSVTAQMLPNESDQSILNML
ncbi:PTS system mannose/fructose/N-acetylgalactosamine-transporter subunit IIB [Lacrimispora saccharolytica]|uniref:PTS system sorbose subfamily IIB component n=1 Tax=Lacrimispora saccharolytica (strain ATCC 35040 / DSM 2544 / NRCC 2533 / WM1) TaxID=610130 RepID=D9R868_LACSW|nr:PTS sugar transporter subunit IIB [Lacrimispora saccharolytica]ADL03820.1 PTS system sorbose subfamily IIB component [[Clostridium] saccharolyticum WM1]QRV21863.1 PTS sugar transporter subunit IIB [Lacrimispora saccharolytica]